eukprot:TRINITY_DN45585_c0_g1_i1.p1 TRINITY_DN45585_c0_g1~~TRINITY_DN45585_c0_g1_i1.p1  ORF type:complete len:390 (+),score=36.44 TRINITY_DN45585_c0_g1_i1:34-1203(+)
MQMADVKHRKRVIIVGGGIIGCSCAYWLRKFSPATEIIILEQETIACHSSGKAAGFLALGWSEGELSSFSYKLHEELARSLTGGTPEDIGYRKMSCIGLGHGGIHQDGARKWLDQCDSSQGRPMGTEATVAQVHPRKLTFALLEASGAVVLEGKRVVGLLVEGGSLTGVQVEDGSRHSCDQVLFCMGAWTQKLAHWLNPDTSQNLRANPELRLFCSTVGHKYTSVVWDCQVEDNTAVFTDSEHHVEIYPRVDEVYACGFPEKSVDLPELPCDIVPDDASVQIVCDVVEAMSKNTLGKGGHVRVAQASFLPSSLDGKPLIGSLLKNRFDNAFLACGHTCWGILNAPASGYAIARLMTDTIDDDNSAQNVRAILKECDPSRKVDERGCEQQ